VKLRERLTKARPLAHHLIATQADVNSLAEEDATAVASTRVPVPSAPVQSPHLFSSRDSEVIGPGIASTQTSLFKAVTRLMTSRRAMTALFITLVYG